MPSARPHTDTSRSQLSRIKSVAVALVAGGAIFSHFACGPLGGCDVPPEEMLHDEQAGCVTTDGGMVCPDAGSGSAAEGVDAGADTAVAQ